MLSCDEIQDRMQQCIDRLPDKNGNYLYRAPDGDQREVNGEVLIGWRRNVVDFDWYHTNWSNMQYIMHVFNQIWKQVK